MTEQTAMRTLTKISISLILTTACLGQSAMFFGQNVSQAPGPPTFSAAHSYSLTLTGSNTYVTPSFAVTTGQIVLLGIAGRVTTNQCSSFAATGTDGTNTDTGTTFQSINGSNPSIVATACSTSFLWTAPHPSATYVITIQGTAIGFGTGLTTVMVFNPGALALTSDGTCLGNGGTTSRSCSTAISPAGTIDLIVSFAGFYDNATVSISGGCCGAIPSGATLGGGNGTSSGAYLIANPVSGTYTPGFSGGAGDGVLVSAWAIK